MTLFDFVAMIGQRIIIRRRMAMGDFSARFADNVRFAKGFHDLSSMDSPICCAETKEQAVSDLALQISGKVLVVDEERHVKARHLYQVPLLEGGSRCWLK